MNLENMTIDELLAMEQKLKGIIAVKDTVQMASKIFLNSLFGCCGNNYFRYYNIDSAEAITVTGQVVIQRLFNGLNSLLNRLANTKDYDFIVAGDTDSCYLSLHPFVESKFGTNIPDNTVLLDFLDNLIKTEILPEISRICGDISTYFNCEHRVLEMKRETIAAAGLWVAKKHYALSSLDTEGVRYPKPKVKVVGLESIKASVPAACREIVGKSIEYILLDTVENLRRYIKESKSKFKTLPFQQIAFSKYINGLKKYGDKNSLYKKGTPLQVRGSLVYNRALKDKGLSTKYQKIADGDLVKFSYLIMPNPLGENVISCSDPLPVELDLDRFIDYDTQFEKGALNPVQAILTAIGWELEEKVTIDDFFGDF